MFRLAVHKVTLVEEGRGGRGTGRVQLDISSEGEPPRRYRLGRFASPGSREYRHLTHLAHSPVTLKLLYGRYLHDHFDGHILFEFLHCDSSELPMYKTIRFARHDTFPVYELSVSVSRVYCEYDFCIDAVTCLSQYAWPWARDSLFAEVEFSLSPFCAEPGPCNQLFLGQYASSETRTMHSSYNATCATLSSFSVTFFIKHAVQRTVLGTLEFLDVDGAVEETLAALRAASESESERVSEPELPPPILYDTGFHHVSSLGPRPVAGVVVEGEGGGVGVPVSASVVESGCGGVGRVSVSPVAGEREGGESGGVWRIGSVELLPDTSAGGGVGVKHAGLSTTATTSAMEPPPAIQLADLQQQQQQQQQQQPQQQQHSPSSNSNAGDETCYKSSMPGALLFRYPGGEDVILNGDSCSRTIKLALYGPYNTGYEVVFTLSKTIEPVNSPMSRQWAPTEALGARGHSLASRLRGVAMIKQDLSNAPPTDGETPPTSANQPLQLAVVSSDTIAHPTHGNTVEALIDGLETFARYAAAMTAACHSISILAWELSLSFGLVLRDRAPPLSPPVPDATPSKWITLDDVLISRALAGVRTRIVVWRHPYLSYLNRLMYLGEVTIDREVARLQRRCSGLGLTCVVLHTDYDNMQANVKHADPFSNSDAHITIIIEGNPKGVYSTRHEKLVVVDAECPAHTVAFVGGFDMARGRFDQPAHRPPLPILPTVQPNRGSLDVGEREMERNAPPPAPPQPATTATNSTTTTTTTSPSIGYGVSFDSDSPAHAEPATSSTNPPTPWNWEDDVEESFTDGRTRFGDRIIQPYLRRIRFLWHDLQLVIQGPATARLSLHFAQRWVHAFSKHSSDVNNVVVPDWHGWYAGREVTSTTCSAHPDNTHVFGRRRHVDCTVSVDRLWQGVVNCTYVFNHFTSVLSSAKHTLYIEHQYPFQNYALTHSLCQALSANPELHVIIVTPIKTDLPGGIVGELFDWSQDHINNHLYLIYATAPERVGVYGLVRQCPVTGVVKPVYVHAKLIIADDTTMLTGSANMDNMSLFRSSELAVTVTSPELALETRMRLCKEHLDAWYSKSMGTDFRKIFKAFQTVATLNNQALHTTQSVVGRPVFLAPKEHNDYIVKIAEDPFSLTHTFEEINPLRAFRRWWAGEEEGDAEFPTVEDIGSELAERLREGITQIRARL